MVLDDVWYILLDLQLFRRVAAALPGMENTQEKQTNDRIHNLMIIETSCKPPVGVLITS